MVDTLLLCNVLQPIYSPFCVYVRSRDLKRKIEWSSRSTENFCLTSSKRQQLQRSKSHESSHCPIICRVLASLCVPLCLALRVDVVQLSVFVKMIVAGSGYLHDSSEGLSFRHLSIFVETHCSGTYIREGNPRLSTVQEL